MLLNLNVKENLDTIFQGGYPYHGELYCPTCGDYRRMSLTRLNISTGTSHVAIPRLFTYICVQCQTKFTAIIYEGPDGPSLAVFPSCRGGLTTPHTPNGVTYYLYQNNKPQSVGTNRAAMAMFP